MKLQWWSTFCHFTIFLVILTSSFFFAEDALDWGNRISEAARHWTGEIERISEAARHWTGEIERISEAARHWTGEIERISEAARQSARQKQTGRRHEEI